MLRTSVQAVRACGHALSAGPSRPRCHISGQIDGFDDIKFYHTSYIHSGRFPIGTDAPAPQAPNHQPPPLLLPQFLSPPPPPRSP